MYNSICDNNPIAIPLLAMLGWKVVDVGRFRNAWIDVRGNLYYIAVHTRLGGDNAECHCAENGIEGCYLHSVIDPILRAHAWYQFEEEDDFDQTYCTFYYSDQSIQERLKEISEVIDYKKPNVFEKLMQMKERWEKGKGREKGEESVEFKPPVEKPGGS